MKNLAIYLMVIIIVSLLLLLAGGSKEAPPVVYVPKEVPMSIRQLQTYLNDKGRPRYRCAIDGKYGKETKQALDNWLCDWHASKHFPKQPKPDKMEKL